MSKARFLVGVFAWAAACSGDDAGRHRSHVPPPGPAVAATAVDAGVAIDAPPPGPPTAALTEDMGAPYFAGSTAAAALAREDWATAASAFSALALAAADPAERGRALALSGVALAELGRWQAAADAFGGARASLPLLADYLGYQEARARYFAHDTARALDLARGVDRASIVGADAELLVGDLLRAAGDPAAIAAHYGDYLARRPDGIRRSEARFRRAEALEAAHDAGPDAAALYRAITVDDPLSSWTTKATARLDALAKAGAAQPPLTIAERLTRAKALFDGMRNPESEAAYADALTAPDRTPADTCVASYHRAQSLFKARNRKEAAPRFDEAIAACTAAGDKDLTVRSAYQAGRSYAYNGDHATSIDRYRAAAAADPANSYADDALLREAEEWADLGDDAQVTPRSSRCRSSSPPGDMRAEALWRLGWRAYRAGDDRKAIGVLAAADRDRADRRQLLGRGPAAVLDRPGPAAPQGDAAGALRSWEDAVRTYPLGYYAMLALNRLAEAAPDRFTRRCWPRSRPIRPASTPRRRRSSLQAARRVRHAGVSPRAVEF
jgi:tetratricopeptide (TPR) repeat protein